VQCTHGEGAAGSIKRLRAMGMAGSLWWDWGLQYFYDLSISFAHLTAFTSVIAQWPVDRSWNTFTAWFALDLIVGVRDLGDAPLVARTAD